MHLKETVVYIRQRHLNLISLCLCVERNEVRKKILKEQKRTHASCYFISVILAHLSFNSIFIRFGGGGRGQYTPILFHFVFLVL